MLKFPQKMSFSDPKLYMNTKIYKYKHNNKDAVEIKLHFINNKELNMLTERMEIN